MPVLTLRSTTETPGAWVQGARESVLCAILLAMGVIPPSVAGNDWCAPASALPWARHIPWQATAAALVFVAFWCLWSRRMHWTLPLAATLHGCVWVENADHIHHVWHLPVLLAWLEASPRLRLEGGRRATVGMWHTHAAIAKLQAHGLGWADGHSMRVWVEAFAYPHVQAITAWTPTWILAAGQWAALCVEAAGVLAVAWPRVCGLALVAFYALVIAAFPFGFGTNMVLVWLYLVAR